MSSQKVNGIAGVSHHFSPPLLFSSILPNPLFFIQQAKRRAHARLFASTPREGMRPRRRFAPPNRTSALLSSLRSVTPTGSVHTPRPPQRVLICTRRVQNKKIPSLGIFLFLLPGRDSNPRPSRYIYPMITYRDGLYHLPFFNGSEALRSSSKQ